MFGTRRNHRHTTARGRLLRVALPFAVLLVCLYTLDWSYMMLETGFDGGLRVLTEEEIDNITRRKTAVRQSSIQTRLTNAPHSPTTSTPRHSSPPTSTVDETRLTNPRHASPPTSAPHSSPPTSAPHSSRPTITPHSSRPTSTPHSSQPTSAPHSSPPTVAHHSSPSALTDDEQQKIAPPDVGHPNMGSDPSTQPPPAPQSTTGTKQVLIPATDTPSNQPLFLVLGDSRSGAEWFLRELTNHHPHVCGDPATVSLLPPPGFSWLSDNDSNKVCTLAFWIEQGKAIQENESLCSTGDETSAAPNLLKMCQVFQNTTTSALDEFLRHYRSESLADCFACSSETRTRGLKLIGEWTDNLPDLNAALAGSKVIRFRRRNRFSHMMSFKTAEASGEWDTRNLDKKRQQLEKLPNDFRVSLKQMADTEQYLSHHESKGDDLAASLGNNTLYLDYEECQGDLASCLQKAYDFLGVDSTLQPKPLSNDEPYPDASELLEHISNREEIREYWGNKGKGEFVGWSSYTPIVHMVRSSDDRHLERSPTYPGVRTTVISGGSEWHEAMIATLEVMPSQTLVVADVSGVADTSAVSPRLRNIDSFLGAVAEFRETYSVLASSEPHAVVLAPLDISNTNSSATVRALSSNLDDLDGLLVGTAVDIYRLFERATDEEKLVTIDVENRLFGDMVYTECEQTRKGTFQPDEKPTRLFVKGRRPSDCFANSTYPEYPVWEEEGLKLGPIINHLKSVSEGGPSVNGIDRFFGPELPYTLDQDGVWVSTKLKNTINEETLKYRVRPTEDLLKSAFDHLTNDESSRWPSLKKELQLGGFPYLTWYGDFKGCNERNAGEESIPVFTMSATVQCSHAFPFPTYMTIINAQPSTEAWLSKMLPSSQEHYTWESKIRKLVWRGSLSENDPTKVFSSQRWRLAKKVFESEQKSLYDIGLVSVPSFLKEQMDIDVSQVGGLVGGISPQEDFQKYLAVLDVDGNSWSSRFGTMLCYNSVIVKVEPQYVDYFFSDLVPWKHYIPVKDDLSDLEDITNFLLDETNDGFVQAVVANANQWCAQHLVTSELAKDVLDIYEGYINLLGKSSPDWSQMWIAEKNRLSQDLELTLL